MHTFHVLQTAFGARRDLDASLPARGLSGEGYRTLAVAYRVAEYLRTHPAPPEQTPAQVAPPAQARAPVSPPEEARAPVGPH